MDYQLIQIKHGAFSLGPKPYATFPWSSKQPSPLRATARAAKILAQKEKYHDTEGSEKGYLHVRT